MIVQTLQRACDVHVHLSSSCSHAVTMLATGRYLVVFGGSTGVKLLNCTWEFDLEAERWRALHPTGSLVPSGRFGHTLTYLKKRRQIFLLGGLDANRVACTDSSYILDISTWTWQVARLGSERSIAHKDGRPASSTSTHPWPKAVGRSAALVSARGLHTSTLTSALSNKLILFGGLLNAAKGNDTLALRHSNTTANQLILIDTDSYHVSEAKTTGTPPCPRYAHAATALDLGNQQATLLVTGGLHLFTDFFCSDLFLLDLLTWTWQAVPALTCGSPDTMRPSAAEDAAAPRGGSLGPVEKVPNNGNNGSGHDAASRKSSAAIFGRDLWNQDKRERERERDDFLERAGEAAEGMLQLPAPGLAHVCQK